MNDKSENLFRLTLYQGNTILAETILDADLFNPLTRYSIDIRSILPSTITNLQKLLSRKLYDVEINGYNLFEYEKKYVKSFPSESRRYIQYNPRSVQFKIDDKLIKGVECKLGLYINDNPIVERLFYVDGFNPVVKNSIDIVDELKNITNKIFKLIKKKDVENMWDDYDMINKLGMSINKIRELSLRDRRRIIRSMNNNSRW